MSRVEDEALDKTADADADWLLLAEARTGDEEAFRRLVDRHQARLYRLCARLLGDSEAAADAVQDVLLKVYRRAGSFRPRGKLSTLLYRIATNHCLNQLRRRRIVTFLRLETGSPEPRADPPDAAPDAQRRLESQERYRRTARAVEALPPGQRAVLHLVKVEGLSYRETAAALGVTVGAVESRLFRAMRSIERSAQEAAAPRVSPSTGRESEGA